MQLVLLKVWAFRFRFLPVVERWVEKLHSVLKKGGYFRTASPAYASLLLRMPWWEALALKNPDIVNQLIRCRCFYFKKHFK